MISNVREGQGDLPSHKVAVYFTANPGVRVELLPGQMLNIAAGANRKMPPVTTPIGVIGVRDLRGGVTRGL